MLSSTVRAHTTTGVVAFRPVMRRCTVTGLAQGLSFPYRGVPVYGDVDGSSKFFFFSSTHVDPLPIYLTIATPSKTLTCTKLAQNYFQVQNYQILTVTIHYVTFSSLIRSNQCQQQLGPLGVYQSRLIGSRCSQAVTNHCMLLPQCPGSLLANGHSGPQ